jgi:hypothetical protein
MLFRFPAQWSEAESAEFMELCTYRRSRPFRRYRQRH